MAREKASRHAADVSSINTDQLVAHVILAGCKDEELLKKLLEIPEMDLNEQKILKNTAEKFEVLKNTSKGLGKDKEDKGGGGRAQQVKGKEGLTCFKCQKVGHFSKECRTPKNQLKCTHCKTEGRHVTNDFCKKRTETAKKEADGNKVREKAKVNKVEGRDDLPAGGEEEQGKANRVRATEDEESEEDSDDDGQEVFANQCLATEEEEEEDHKRTTPKFHETEPKSSIKNGHGS